MKKIKMYVFAILCFIAPGVSSAQETLSNQSIAALVTAKLSNQLIINKIRSTANNFDMSASAIIELKREKVPDPLIDEMLHATKNLPVVTNQDVMQMNTNNIANKLILKKISLSNCQFNTSTESLIALKTAKVPENITKAMMASSGSSSSTTPASTSSSQSTKQQNAPSTAKSNVSNEKTNRPDPIGAHSPGIYYDNPANAAKRLTRVDPSVSSSSSTGGASFQGFGGSSTESRVSGAESMMQISETSPVFYFYFKNDENANSDNWFFASATSPKEFVLVNFIVNKKNNFRAFKTGSTSRQMYHTSESSGIPEKMKVQFTYSEVSEGVYKVTFNQPLKPGEYCFTYASSVPSRHDNNKVFDFGVR